MQYDDRLATVLRMNGASATVARIQFQQLVDLLGTSAAGARGELLDQAHVRLAELAQRLPASERAAALAIPGLRLRSPRLLATLTRAEPVVAAAALRAADLTEAQWLDLIPALSPSARGVMGVRDDYPAAVRALMARLGMGGRALPGASAEPLTNPMPTAVREPMDSAARSPADMIEIETLAERQPEDQRSPAEGSNSGIAAIVRRIEAFRRARDTGVDLPQLPLGDNPVQPIVQPGSLDFTTDGLGRINWADRRFAPMLVGTDLGRRVALRTAMHRRQPLQGLVITLDGAVAISGTWRVDALPRFDEHGGRFIGYLGRMRRLEADENASPASTGSRSDALRQVLHELRTPVNAIQGFAEIIQHQLYGPAPHEYRALSAVIVADAARMLAGFEELDRLAKLGAGSATLSEGECDLAAVLHGAVGRLEAQGQARGFTIRCEAPESPLPVAMADIEAERLVWRLLGAVASAAQAGDALTVAIGVRGGRATTAITLPGSLALLDDAALFSGEALGGNASAAVEPAPLTGMFGIGFALRLARIEARAAGGCLSRHEEMLNLSLPLLTPGTASHSDGVPGRNERKDAPAA